MIKFYILTVLCCAFSLCSIAQPKNPQQGMTPAEMEAYLKKMGIKLPGKIPTGSMPAPARNTAVSQPAAAQNTDIKVAMSKKGTNLMNVYKSGILPPTLAIAIPNPKDRAAYLVKKINDGNPDAAAAMVSVVKEAGFYIRRNNGAFIQPPQSNNGIIPESDLGGYIKYTANGFGIDAGLFFSTIFSYNRQYVVNGAQVMQAFVKSCIASTKKNEQFLGYFLQENSLKKEGYAYNVLQNQSISGDPLRLDAIDVMLVCYSLMPGIYQRFAGRAENSTSPAGPPRSGPNNEQTDFPLPPDETPCSISLEGYIKDATATGLTTGWGNAIESMAEKGDQFAKSVNASNVVPLANRIAASAKFLATYALLKFDFESETNLVRSRTTRDGQSLPLKLTLKVDDPFDKHKFLNSDCTRMAVNAVFGVDFNISTGAVPNVEVQWLVDVSGEYTTQPGGGQAIGMAAKALIGNMGFGNTGEYTNCKNEYVKLEGGNIDDCISRTNNDGEVNVDVVARGLQRDLTANEVKPIWRVVKIFVAPKLKNTDVSASNFTDMGAIGVSLLSGLPTMNFVDAGLGLATESLYRLSWAPSDPYIITLRDWDYCKNYISLQGVTDCIKSTEMDKEKSLLSPSRAVITHGKMVLTLVGFNDNGKKLINLNLQLDGTGAGSYQWSCPGFNKGPCQNAPKLQGRAQISLRIANAPASDMVGSISSMFGQGEPTTGSVGFQRHSKDEIEDDGVESKCITKVWGSTGTVVIDKVDRIKEVVSGSISGTLLRRFDTDLEETPPISVPFKARFSVSLVDPTLSPEQLKKFKAVPGVVPRNY